MADPENESSSGDSPYFNAPGQPQLQAALNRLVDSVNAAKGVNMLGSDDIAVERNGDNWQFKLIPGTLHDASVRFFLRYDQTNHRLYVGKGHVAFIPLDSGVINPIEPFIKMGEGEDAPKIKIWSETIPETEMPPYLEVPEGETACSADGSEFWVLVKASTGTAELIIHDTEEQLPKIKEGEFYFQIGSFKVCTGEDGKETVNELKQIWESDITLIDVEVPSSSGSSSSGGESKTTAIVPASWTPDKYTALFIAEMPEVRFDDVVRVRVPEDARGRYTVDLDSRYVEVCEKGTIEVVGYATDRATCCGFRVNGGRVTIELPWFRRPSYINMRLSAFRKDFFGLRFPNRNGKQFEENESFINSAYSGAKGED